MWEDEDPLMIDTQRRWGTSNRILSLACLLLGAAFIVGMAASQAQAQQEPDGRLVYLDECASCHQGTGLGLPGEYPPLVDNPNIADADYIHTVITEGREGPIDVNGVTYDDEMPAIPLSDAEIDAVIAYIHGGVFIPEDIAAVGEGNVAIGRMLFSGRMGLENGGPACHACHSAGSVGNLGGRTLGPDLTDLAERYGDRDILAAALADPASMTMEPIFNGKGLTDDERAHLTTYFASLTKPSDLPFDLLLVIGLAGAAALFGVMHLVSKRNRINYLQQLRSKS